MSKVAIIMGSINDYEIVKAAGEMLTEFSIQHTVNVMSAHRTPDAVTEFAKNARAKGYSVIIAAAGMAAHLAGYAAANTTLPVIAIPMSTKQFGGLDALMSSIQMPPGIPVACVAVDGAKNAALLAVEMLSIADNTLVEKLEAYRKKMALAVEKANAGLSEAKN